MAVRLTAAGTRWPGFKVCNDLLRLRTGGSQQFIDVTERVVERVRRSGVSHGWVNVQTRHTTTAIVVNENEPLLLEDLQGLLDRWAPRGARYRHDDLDARRPPVPPGERRNGHSHARAIMLGTSESLNIVDGRIQLGRWQRVFLVELDGGQERTVSVSVMGLVDEALAPKNVESAA